MFYFLTNSTIQLQLAYLLTLTNGIFFISHYIFHKRYENELQLQLHNYRLELSFMKKLDLMNHKLSILIEKEYAKETICNKEKEQTEKANTIPIPMDSYFCINDETDVDFEYVSNKLKEKTELLKSHTQTQNQNTFYNFLSTWRYF